MLAGGGACGWAGSVVPGEGLAGPGALDVRIASWAERRFQTVFHQQYDFSCGSAALASLLAFHYEDPVGEAAVFADLWAHGEAERIRREGFSLLDMKRYLERRGYRADGFRIGLDRLARAGVPAITLVEQAGYRHFVIIKGVDRGGVLLGDPAAGVRTLDRAGFEAQWGHRILFVIRDRKGRPAARFNEAREWGLSPRAPLGAAVGAADLAVSNLLRPGPWEF
jgi:predicted double-glycine peptidase